MERRMNNTALSNDRPARFAKAMTELPLVAIVRGVKPAEVVEIGQVLHEAGFGLIEVPLNSPEPFESIALLRSALPASVLVGAGTVRELADVQRLLDLAADLVVMPHADVAIIRAAKTAGLLCVPGVATPTEAFAALDAGADALKLFPAEMVTPAVLKALRAVLPQGLHLIPVGGITPSSLGAWQLAGATGFGLGSALYAPGSPASAVAERARDFVRAWHALMPRRSTP
jgi:2-dehydro-3-deoxyphosphogalactonate aldolase